MARMNYNRPQFQKQKVWVKHDQYVSASRRPACTSSPRRRGVGPLDQFLQRFDGDVSFTQDETDFLRVVKAKRAHGEPLTPTEAGRAGSLLQKAIRNGSWQPT